MVPKQGTSVYRGVSWNKSAKRWKVKIRRLNAQTYIGRYIDEVEAALAYDAAAIALGKIDCLNFPEKVLEANITDALLLKLFKTTDRDKVEEMVRQHQKENGIVMSEKWKALLKRNLNPMPEALDLPDRRAQVDSQNHGYRFVAYSAGGRKGIRPYRGQVKLNAKEQDELPESLRAGASKEKQKAISTSTFGTAEEAAKAVDRLLYKIGRHSFINFPLSEEERAELDSIGMEELIASFRQAGNNNRGTSVYRGISWKKSSERWYVQIVCLNEQTSKYIGVYADEVEAALAYDTAAIALGKTDGLNFPDKVFEARITDALLLKLFKTTDRDKVKEIVEQHQKEKGNAMSEEWKALLKRKSNIMLEDPECTLGKVGRKRKSPAPRGSRKKANRSESSEEDIEEEEEEELPMHNDGSKGNVDNGVGDDNEQAIHEDEGTDDAQGQGPAATSTHHAGPVPRKKRRRERRGEGISGEEGAKPPREVHAGSGGPGGFGDPLVIGDQQQQVRDTGGLMAPADLQSAVVVKQEPDCLQQVVGAHLGLAFPAQASLFPAQAPAFSSQELASVLPTSMDTQLGPSLLDTIAFESISGWIPLNDGENVTEDEPCAQPPHSKLPHAQLPHNGGLMASADPQSAVVVKQESDCLDSRASWWGSSWPCIPTPS